VPTQISGCIYFSGRCEKIETKARTRDLDGMENLLLDLSVCYDDTIIHLEKLA
jgi:hypothetical protein